MNKRISKLLNKYASSLNTDNKEKTKDDLKKFWYSLDSKNKDKFKKDIEEVLSK